MSVYKTLWGYPPCAEAWLKEHGIHIRRPDKAPEVYHTHPVAATLRNYFEDILLAPHHGKKIKSVGGNDVRHAKRHASYDIHSCCPLLDGMDAIREAKRSTSVRGNRCHRKFQDCDVPAEVYLFSHSMYYVQKQELAGIPIGAHVLASHHVYPSAGTYCFGEMHVTGDPSMWTVITRGNDHPYHHPQVWLTSECVITTGFSIIAFAKVRQVDTACAFTGVVQPSSLLRHTLDPVPITYERPVTDLMKFIRTEAAGVTITTRLIHTMQLRARSWCTAHDIPIPGDIDQQVVDGINMGMDSTINAWAQIDLDKVQLVNDTIEGIQSTENVTTWQRCGKLLWKITNKCTEVLAYTYPTSLPTIKQLYSHTKAKVSGGLTRFLTQYACAKIKEARWFTSTWYQVPTCIPANVAENEITSIFTRSLPPSTAVSIPQKVTDAALFIASVIGKVESPMDFDEWLSRFDQHRRTQLREALDRPLSTTVEYFQKIEQLDEPKEPRAIQARVDEFKAHLGPWIAQLEHTARDRLPIFVKGLDSVAKAEKIDQLRQRSTLSLELDFSRFDRSLSQELLLATEHAIYRHCLPKNIARAMTLQLRNHIRTRNNASYTVDGSRMSGDVNTSIGNCLVVASLMIAIGLPLSAFLVEGDDMIASITHKEKKSLNLQLLEDVGLTPKVRIVPHEESEFCSRRIIHTVQGPRSCRDPAREIRRIGYSINSETDREKLLRGVQEWAGIPMLGPKYETAAGLPVTPIPIETREEFAQVWGYDHDTQVRFETDPVFQHEFAIQIAAPDATPSRDSHSALQGAPRISRSRNETVPVRTRVVRTTPPRREGQDVRDVQTARTRESPIPRGCGHDDKRRSTDRRRLRRTRRGTVVPGHSSPVAQEHDSCMERLNPQRSAQQSDEAEVVGNSLRHDRQRRRQRPKQLSRRCGSLCP